MLRSISRHEDDSEGRVSLREKDAREQAAKILSHKQLSRAFFHPRRNTKPLPSEYAFNINCGDASLACYFERCGSQTAMTMIHFHGNGELVQEYVDYEYNEQDSSSMGNGGNGNQDDVDIDNGVVEFKDAILSMNLNILFVEYRGYGSSTGNADIVRMLNDVDCVFEALEIPEDQLIVFGRSLGSIYATEFAYRHARIAGLVLESGIAEVMEMFHQRINPETFGSSWDEVKKAVDVLLNQKEKMRLFKGNLLILHAEMDKSVVLSHAEKMYNWAGTKKKGLIIFEEGDHNTIYITNMIEYVAELRKFVRQCGNEIPTIATGDPNNMTISEFCIPNNNSSNSNNNNTAALVDHQHRVDDSAVGSSSSLRNGTFISIGD